MPQHILGHFQYRGGHFERPLNIVTNLEHLDRFATFHDLEDLSSDSLPKSSFAISVKTTHGLSAKEARVSEGDELVVTFEKLTENYL
jgi:hypothetical protein